MARVIRDYDSGRSSLMRDSSRSLGAIIKLKVNLRPKLLLRLIELAMGSG